MGSPTPLPKSERSSAQHGLPLGCSYSLPFPGLNAGKVVSQQHEKLLHPWGWRSRGEIAMAEPWSWDTRVELEPQQGCPEGAGGTKVGGTFVRIRSHGIDTTTV